MKRPPRFRNLMASRIQVLLATTGKNTSLAATLSSLADCVLPDRYNGVTIVENGPAQGAQSIVESAPQRLRATYLHVDQANKNVAINAGIKSLDDSTLVIFTDDDVRFSDNILVKYAEVTEHIENGEYFGGPTGVDYESPPDEWLIPFLPPSARGWSPEIEETDLGPGVFLGFNWAAFAGDIRRTGGFDPQLGPGSPIGIGDETDMHIRLQRIGVKPTFLPDAKVWHYVPKRRCTKKWIIRRWYRRGMCESLYGGPYGSQELFGVPRWRLAKWVGYIWRYVIALPFGREHRLKARIELSRYTGMIYGIRNTDRIRGDKGRPESHRLATPRADCTT